MSLRLGADARLYLNTSVDPDPWTNPIWTHKKNVRDLTLNLEADKAEATSRNSNKVKMVEPVLHARGVEWEMLEDTSDTLFTALQTAFLARSSVDLFFCSGDKAASGETYARAVFKVTSFKKTEPLADINKRAVMVEPCYDSHAAQTGITGGGTIQLAFSTATTGKGVASSLIIRVERAAGTAASATVNYATANGTVTAGVDYTSTSGTITWAEGEAWRDITVPILGAGNAGTFTFTISTAGGGGALGTPTVCTVTLS